MEKVFIGEEELDGIEEIDGILNLVNLPRTMLIDSEFRNPKVVAGGGELTRNVNKKKPDGLQA